MSEFYTGVRVIHTSKENIDQFYKDGMIEIWDKRLRLSENQNLYVVLNDKIYDGDGKEIYQGSASAIARVQGDNLVKLPLSRDIMLSGVKPRNKEQIMAFDALTDVGINVVTLTGSAGTGKTLCTLSAALHMYDQKQYDRIILTRPMTQVGKHDLGILPGEVEDKFGPYLRNYMCNFEHLVGGRIKNIDHLIESYCMEFVPFQLIRGASFRNAFIIADEVQTLPYEDMLTLGTRVGENSKLVIMGDLNQRDEKIAKDRTGLHKWVNSDISRKSPITASIHLIKCERSEVSRLFAEVFEE